MTRLVRIAPLLLVLGCKGDDEPEPEKLLDTGWFTDTAAVATNPDTCPHRFVSTFPAGGESRWYYRDRPSAFVATSWAGLEPTLVSPDSIKASAPSRTALATSLASARVGRVAVIIESSIWVATMTGFAAARHSEIARFWTSGTASRGSSTPKSPRATMTPSKAATI